eukprot:4158055-Prymnesium_polylepis.1
MRLPDLASWVTAQTTALSLNRRLFVLRFIGADGKPFNTFYDLAELDLTKSSDGCSPDAPWCANALPPSPPSRRLCVRAGWLAPATPRHV